MWRRDGAAGRNVSLLVVRVLFKLFVISIVQYLELLLNSIPKFVPNVLKRLKRRRHETASIWKTARSHAGARSATKRD